MLMMNVSNMVRNRKRFEVRFFNGSQLLRDKSKTIQHEAFHVFKVFVANPNKPADIVDILVCRYLCIFVCENFMNALSFLGS